MENDRPSPRESTPAATGPSRFGAAGAGSSARGESKPGGALSQAWLNLVVWYPFLLGSGLRSRRVVYDGREVNQGGKWSVTLPKQCWCCGTQQRVESQQVARDVRVYDVPPAMLLLGAVVAVLLLSIGVFTSIWVVVLGLVLIGAGAALLMLKSWREPVRMVIWNCDMHADELRVPDLVIYDNELYLFAPSASLAEAATAELMARRRKGRRYAEDADGGGGGASSDSSRPARSPPGEEPRAAPPSVTRPLREALPPIKLDD